MVDHVRLLFSPIANTGNKDIFPSLMDKLMNNSLGQAVAPKLVLPIRKICGVSDSPCVTAMSLVESLLKDKCHT